MSQTRMTKQRSIILEALRSVKTHPSPDEIYQMVRKKLPRISLGTVYRNLDLLAASGEISQIDKAGRQKRFDGDMRPHYHVRCETCGDIGDVFTRIGEFDYSTLSSPDFAIHGIDLMFLGECPSCRAMRT